jgi:hypothetical protein
MSKGPMSTATVTNKTADTSVDVQPTPSVMLRSPYKYLALNVTARDMASTTSHTPTRIVLNHLTLVGGPPLMEN